MCDEQWIAKLAELEQKYRGCQHQLDDLQKNGELLHRMVTSLEVLATRQENMADQVTRIDKKVSQLEEVPSRRWHALVGYGIASLVSAALTYFGTVFWG